MVDKKVKVYCIVELDTLNRNILNPKFGKKYPFLSLKDVNFQTLKKALGTPYSVQCTLY